MMKKYTVTTARKWLTAFLFSVLFFVMLPAVASAVATGATGAGWNIFDPATSPFGTYRYGPAFIINDDDSIDVWTCAQDHNGAWDNIRYKRSTDGGLTWGTESVAIAPTPGSRDAFSTCDPGVFKYGSYYYLGYTSTEDPYGGSNQVYVARSANPGGPYEKWNGSGWGGNPQPFITYSDWPDPYGIGEPSFVVKGTTLYAYYDYSGRDSNDKRVSQTRVVTANLANPNWPGSTTYQGIAIHRDIEDNFGSDDSTDHKYVPAWDKFIAIGASKRFGPYSYIRMYESSDGITYHPATLHKNYLNAYLHNVGISGNALGQIDLTQDNFLAYAYGTEWGYWYTAMHPLSLSNTSLPAVPYLKAAHEGNGQVTLHFRTSGVPGETYKIKYGTTSGVYTSTITGVTSSPYTVTGLTNGIAYFFTVVASNASGDSANSNQMEATPLVYSSSPRTGVSASSYHPSGWEAAKAIDNDVATTYSSAEQMSENNPVWITVDMGAAKSVKRVTLAPRINNEFAYPLDYKIQVSQDNVNWVDAKYERYRLNDGYVRYVHKFQEPLYGRYVRVYAERLFYDQYRDYYLQLGDIGIEDIPYSVISSSQLSGWEKERVIDGDASTKWSSNVHGSENGTEWIGVNMGAVRQVFSVALTPKGLCFPKDFKLQSSTDGTTWTDIPGHAYTNYSDPGTTVQKFHFGTPVTAQFIRVYATKLRSDGTYYYFQLAEISLNAAYINRTVNVSSTLPGWPSSQLADNDPSTNWSSAGHATAANVEWASIDMGSQQYISELIVAPRAEYCFPVDFKLQSSPDGTTWTDIAGHTYSGYYHPGSEAQVFTFNGLLNTRHVRLYATKLRSDGSAYYMQLGEISAKR